MLFTLAVKIRAHPWPELLFGRSLSDLGTAVGQPGALQFRSLQDRHMLEISMPKSSGATKISAAELALKAHVLVSDPEILAEMTDGDSMIQEIADMVNLTEAPEDAVCGLVIDLLQYCKREKIDWTKDVMSRAWQHVRSKRASASN